MSIEDYENRYEDLSNEELVDELCFMTKNLFIYKNSEIKDKCEALRNVILKKMGGNENERV